jgi:predicted membrane chloride channel (bestrophin family)
VASLLSIPSSAHGFVVSSLGLLLVFRTNSAYQRFLVGILW